MSELTDGPAMQALSEQQRLFVLAMASDPFSPHSEWAKAAGYSDTGDGCRVRASVLIRNPKIQAASLEVARATMQVLGPAMGVAALMKIAADAGHKDRAKAAGMLLDRAGMAPVQQISVTHTNLTGERLMGRIAELAGRLGLDPQKLLGANTIDGDFKVVEHGGVQNGTVRREERAEPAGQPVQEGRDRAGGAGRSGSD